MKILLTGGHPAPALAFIDYVRNHPPAETVSFIFVGRKFNNNREQSESYEYREVTSRGIPFIHLTTGRLTRVFTPEALRDTLRIPAGFLEADGIVQTVKPDRVLVFGGYLALPVALAAYRRGIPVFIHEQTMAAGIASRIIGRFAKRVFLSFPDHSHSFQKTKTIVTGNLLRHSIFTEKTLPFSLQENVPVIYVTGGSLGSHSLNILVEATLEKLLKHFTIIHQIGNMHEFNDFNRLSRRHAQLPPELQARYFPVEHIPDEAIGAVYARAMILVGRSGANTISELIALRKPSLLVPLPWSARDEQRIQARMMEEARVAMVFEQNGTPDEFFRAVMKVYSNASAMVSRFDSLSGFFHPHAAGIVRDAVMEG
ncbi:MAG: UDP-N-acetylglucosamine--N-acetylmuramyl-(pentapeptide) pyrophosphoryl-undecaprenol N-acetylglucosamine transferase [Patescibacteria group bacterium]|nr:UDP-N-acetylglucosamine--N-acetylmuramyl-(pentapeptide) pyrophosphoryl-undecaprenol N-acetylglucosamine transferase [Patescibacteria group bacterium]